MQPPISWKFVFGCAGTVMASLIGSGFTTGQEILQYFTAYGRSGLYAALGVCAGLVYACLFFVKSGQEHHFKRGSGIYYHVLGKKFGKLFDVYCTLAVYCSFIIMSAGVGAVVRQQYGAPAWLGSVLLGLIASFCVLRGLKNLSMLLGKIGFLSVSCIFVLAGAAISNRVQSFADGAEALARLDVTAASASPVGAACSYIGVGIVCVAVFLTAVGGIAKSGREAVIGGLMGVAGFMLALTLVFAAQLTNIEWIHGYTIPNLRLAERLSPAFADFFSCVILVGSCTAAMPLLWTSAARFADEGTKSFTVSTVVLACIGTVCGICFDFAVLVNTVCVINGYVGASMVPFMIVKDIAYRFKKGRLRRR